jgi:glycosyltransferase involved in cell wall biosynthesis
MTRLLIFTHLFPFDRGETFLAHELEYLARVFDKTYVLPLYAEGKISNKAMPKNCEGVAPLEWTSSRSRHASSWLQTVVLLLRYATLLASELRYLGKSRWRWKVTFNLLHESAALESALTDYFRNTDLADCQIYSYWMDTSLLIALIRLKRRGILKGDIFSRAHGHDVYWERHRVGYIPFYRYVVSHIDKVFAISEHGRQYLLRRTRVSRDHIALARLGVPSVPGRARPSDDGVLRIVSCSGMTPVKRLHLLAAALRLVTRPVTWTHFGDGTEKSGIESVARDLPPDVSVVLMGHRDLGEIEVYYMENPVDLFVNVSESEGIPVSIMESMRFGIPVLATEVGGTPEIVVGNAGLLISPDITPEGIAGALDEYARFSIERRGMMREEAFRQWERQYRSEINFPEFARQLVPGHRLRHDIKDVVE